MSARCILIMAWVCVPSIAALAQWSAGPGFVAQLPLQDLPPGPVHSLAMDGPGMLWIGTSHGLCRYDGTNLDLFRHVPGDSMSLPGNFVGALLHGPDGRLWAGGTGLSVRDRQSGQFRRIPLRTPEGKTTSFECLQLWAGPDSTLWAACNRHGLARYDPVEDCLVPVDGTDTRSRANSIWGGPHGLWFTSITQLIQYDPVSGRQVAHDFAAPGKPLPKGTLFTTVTRIASDPDALWIGGWGLGLVRFDRKDGTFQGPFLWQQGEPTLTNIVYRMAPWEGKGILVATNSGLLRFDLATHTFSAPLPWAGETAGTFGTGVHGLLPLADGTVWVGSEGRLGLLPPQATLMPLDIPRGNVTVVRDPKANGYWASRYYEGRKLMRLDSSGHVVRSWELPRADRDKYEPFYLLATAGNGVFIGTTQGLLRLAPGADRVEEVEVPWPGGRTYVNSLLELPDGSVLLATAIHGCWRLTPGDGSVRLMAPPPRHNGQVMQWCTAHVMLDDDHVLLSFHGGGLGVLDLGAGRIDLVPAGATGMPFLGDLVALVPAGEALIAAMRTSGMASLRWNGPGASPAFSLLATFQLPGQYDVFNDAVADADGKVWIAGTSGLLRFDPISGHFVRCSTFEGFPPGEVSHLFNDGPHHVVAIGTSGFRFDVRKAVPLRPRPGVYMRSWMVNGADQGPIPANGGPPLLLEHDRNTITLAYSGIDLLHAGQLEFEVMLEGHDRKWLDNGGARTVTYVALVPGTYQFAVRVKGMDGPIVRQAIIIRPAFWQTWWFKILVVVAGLLLVSLATRYILRLHYRRRIAELEREREVQRTRMRIARDIHDGIGGGLTRIALLSRRMNARNHEETAARIAEASTELVRELGEIVWTVNPENDTRSAFMAYVRSSLGRQFDELDVKLRLDLSMTPGEEEMPLPPEVKRNTVLILREAVNNALKHANATGVEVRLHLAGGRLDLRVADNGRGFDPVARAQAGNGLANLRKRALAVGGDLSLESSPGQGTVMHFTCPLPPTFM